MKPSLTRPLQLTTATFAAVTISVFVLVGGLAYRSHLRTRMAQESLEQLAAESGACLAISQILSAGGPDLASDGAVADRARRALDLSIQTSAQQDPRGLDSLRQARAQLGTSGPAHPDAAAAALASCRRGVDELTASLEQRVRPMRADADRELSLALGAPIVLLAMMAGMVLYARARLFGPLHDLGILISRLSDGDMRPVPIHPADPTVLPLFENYNHLVNRLRSLEEAHRARAETLTQEVQAATHALLAQQQSLARAERLAVAGELSANLAHELRNPLAAIEITLTNLEREAADADTAERLRLVGDEIMRLSRLLDGMLNATRHEPEASRTIRLAGMVAEMLTLVRYQLPAGVTVEAEIPQDLRAELPEDRLRQSLLNLVLNAAQVMQETGGTIEVSAGLEKGLVRIDVKDEGPGMSDDVRRALGQPFTSSRKGGTGLGLAIVSRFVRDMGGKLAIEDVAPHGCRVTMTLPTGETHA